MKKSFKILLLAVMALCLAASASFADGNAKVSYDIEITIASVDAHVTVISPDMPIKVGSADLDKTSDDIKEAVKKVVEVSFDSESADVKLTVKINGLAGGELKSADVAAVYLASADKGATKDAASVDITATSNDINVAWNDSFDLVVVVKGNGMGSSFVVVKVVGHGVEPVDENTFKGASIDVYYVVDEELTSKPVTFTATASQSITVDLGSTVSFDVSASSSDLTSADDSLTSSDYMFVLTAPTTAGASVDVAFAFNKGAVVYTFKIVASGDSSGGGSDDGETKSITVDDIDEDTQEAINEIIPSKYKTITLDKLVEQLNKLIAALSGVKFETVSVDIAGDFDTVTAVKSDGTVVAAAFPAVNGFVFLPVSSGTISNSFPSSLPSFDEAVTAFGFTDFSDFTDKVFDEVTSLTEREADFTEDVATETFDITLGSALPYGTIIVFALQPTDDTLNLATQYVAMVINGTFGDTSSTLTFDMNKVYNAADLQTKASITEGEYDIAYSTLDGAGKGVESAALKAAFEAAAAGEEGEVGYVGAVTLGTSSSEETTNETSSHGSSSGCDAGFGALALLAVAGALATRKVRK